MLFAADEIDDIAYSIMCHNGELPTKTIENEILNTLDVKIYNSIETNKKIKNCFEGYYVIND